MFKQGLSLLALTITSVIAQSSVQAGEAPPTLEAMWKVIQQQQAEISNLKKQLSTTQQDLSVTDEKIEATGALLDQQSQSGSSKASWADKTQVGGYGELHYNNLSNDGSKGDKQEVDFHRFVLFFNHQFSDSVRLFTELELEHAFSGEGKPGEVELEQAFVEMDINADLTAKAGVFLLPVGIINETHEPPTFYGTERNPIEKNIIPTTWWEAGAGLTARSANGLQYDLALHSGLKVDDSYNIRKGRKKTAKAPANSPAFTGRLKYTGMPGLELATTLNYQSDISQDSIDEAGNALLWESHVVYQKNNFALRALYAQWRLSGAGAEAAGKDKQMGWYIEPSYKFTDKIGIFARYNVWDNSVDSGKDSEYSQIDVGLNYWPDPNVVIKLDYQQQSAPTGKDAYDGVNIGVGYQF